MADILIRGMEMPDCCEKCPFLDYEQGYCFASGKKQKDGWYDCNLYAGSNYVGGNEKRHEDCPLVAMPSGHGRLVDADKIFATCVDERGYYISFNAAVIGEAVDGAQTIVPAELEVESNG